MCKVHNKVYGSNSVELYAEARILNNVCDARLTYLRTQAMSFHAWLGTQEWCEDASIFCQHIVTHVEKALDPDTDKYCEYLFEDNEVSASDTVGHEFTSYLQGMETIADKGMRKAYSSEEKIKVMEARLEDYVVELALHDKIQDCMDTLPTYKVEGQYKAVFTRLDVLKNQGKLSYSGWTMFSNQLMEKMGKPGIKSKYEIKCLADQIVDLEVKIANLNKEIMERPEFFSDPHEAADEFIQQHILVTE